MPKVITTILLDDNPKGLRLIEMANWSGKAFVSPRAKLKELRARGDAQQPGLYFLFGDGEDRPTAYIGQSENVVERLVSHDFNREEDEWNTAFVFTGNLDSTFIKYLESISLDLAKRAGRHKIFNSASPKENQLSEAQKIVAVEYFDRIKTIIGLFGYSVFDDPKEQQKGGIYFFEDVKNKDASATGTLLETGEFVVYKGSKARIAVTDGLQKHGMNVIALRTELVTQGILVSDGDKSLIFNHDYIFSAPSMAATVVAGRACNGWTCWKDKQGRTLDENVRKPAE